MTKKKTTNRKTKKTAHRKTDKKNAKNPEEKSTGKRNLPKITNSEWDVLMALWNHGPATAPEIRKSLEDKWSNWTVHSYLARLVAKNW